jgi:hypothetical protein
VIPVLQRASNEVAEFLTVTLIDVVEAIVAVKTRLGEWLFVVYAILKLFKAMIKWHPPVKLTALLAVVVTDIVLPEFINAGNLLPPKLVEKWLKRVIFDGITIYLSCKVLTFLEGERVNDTLIELLVFADIEVDIEYVVPIVKLIALLNL